MEFEGFKRFQGFELNLTGFQGNSGDLRDFKRFHGISRDFKGGTLMYISYIKYIK